MRVDRCGLFRLGATLLIAATLASCGPPKNKFPPACPVPGLIKPLGEITRYRAGSRDVRDLVIRARIIDVQGKCEWGDDNNSEVATATLVVEATRGPGMQGDAVTLPVFIAISDSAAIRDKTLFAMPVEFPRNVDSTRAVSKEVRMVIPVTAEKSGAAYGIIGGFQLTPEEVAAWRRANRR